MRTYRVVKLAYTSRTGGCKVVGHESLDACFFCCENCVLLEGNSRYIDGADDDTDIFEGLLQRLDVIAEVCYADLDAGLAQLLYCWL